MASQVLPKMPGWSPPALPQIFHALHDALIQIRNICFSSKRQPDMDNAAKTAASTARPAVCPPLRSPRSALSDFHFALTGFPLRLRQALPLPRSGPGICPHRKALPEVSSRDTLRHFPLSDTESLWCRWNVHTMLPAA